MACTPRVAADQRAQVGDGESAVIELPAAQRDFREAAVPSKEIQVPN
jgi:hypothetical protein